MPHGVMPPEQLASEPLEVVPTLAAPTSGPVNSQSGSAPVMRRLYGEGETTCQRPSASFLTCRTELPTDSCSSSIWATVLFAAVVTPCWKNGAGYSWLTNSRPSSGLPSSGKKARKSLL